MRINYNKLSYLLKVYRTARNLSRTQMAELLNLNKSVYSRIENAQVHIDLDLLIVIAEVMGLPPVTLFGYLCDYNEVACFEW